MSRSKRILVLSIVGALLMVFVAPAYAARGTQELTLQYDGQAEAEVRVDQTTQGNQAVVQATKVQTTIFSGVVQPGDQIDLVGADRNGNLGPVLRIRVNGRLHTTIRTNCSLILMPGMRFGDFTVVSATQNCSDDEGDDDDDDGGGDDGGGDDGGGDDGGGDDGGGGDQAQCGECDGQVTVLTLAYNGEEAADVMVTQKIRSQEVTIFEGTVEPGDTFTVTGQSNHGTLGSKILIYADGKWVGRIHTSCSEPIGPGLVLGDFEVVEGESRNGGPLCALDGGGDGGGDGEGDGGGGGEEPDCGECDGQVTELTLLYTGDEEAEVRVTQKIRSQEVTIFDNLVQPDQSFSVSGGNRNGTFGSKILIYADDHWVGRIHTSCSEPIGPGLVLLDFEVVEGQSRNGGLLCPLEDGEGDGVDDQTGCNECDGQATQLTLRYNGDDTAHIEVTQKVRKSDVTIFDDLVDPDDPFTIFGAKPDGRLGSNIKIYVEGAFAAAIHTSCSEPLGAGLVVGDFEVIDGASRNGGRLCPLPADDGE